jgi:hypothetical protein
MTLQIRLSELAQAIAVDVKKLYINLSALTTTAKSNLVSAINELNSSFLAAGIDDTAPSTSLTKSYSANKVTELLVSLKSDILGGAGASYDTLLELQNLLVNDESAISGLLAAVANRVRFDESQSLTAAQSLIARTNIGAVGFVDTGDLETNLVSVYNTAKA